MRHSPCSPPFRKQSPAATGSGCVSQAVSSKSSTRMFQYQPTGSSWARQLMRRTVQPDTSACSPLVITTSLTTSVAGTLRAVRVSPLLPRSAHQPVLPRRVPRVRPSPPVPAPAQAAVNHLPFPRQHPSARQVANHRQPRPPSHLQPASRRVFPPARVRVRVRQSQPALVQVPVFRLPRQNRHPSVPQPPSAHPQVRVRAYRPHQACRRRVVKALHSHPPHQ